MRRPSDLRVYRRLLSQARPYWIHLAGIFVLSLLAIPLGAPYAVTAQDHRRQRAWLGAACRRNRSCGTSSGSQSRTPALCSSRWGFSSSSRCFSHLRGFATGVLETYTGEKLVLASGRSSSNACSAYHSPTTTARDTDSVYRIQYDAPAIQWVAVQGIIPFVSAV